MAKYTQISDDKYQKEAIELLNNLNQFQRKVFYFNRNNTRQIDSEYLKINTEKLIQLLEYVTYTEKEVDK